MPQDLRKLFTRAVLCKLAERSSFRCGVGGFEIFVRETDGVLEAVVRGGADYKVWIFQRGPLV